MSKVYEQLFGSTDRLVNALLEENRRLRAAVEAYPEWTNTEEYVWECRVCKARWREYNPEDKEHKPDCARQSALRQSEGE